MLSDPKPACPAALQTTNCIGFVSDINPAQHESCAQ
jgi:hypothetical protein